MKVLVLLGGNSPERDVSLRSGENVSSVLKTLGHEVYDYDPINGYEGLNDYAGKVDCVLPMLHGRGGEDGEVQLELEKRNLKYLGADPRVSAITFDKVEFKEILNKLSILTPKSEVVNKQSFMGSELIKKPFVLKPIDGGSTIDAFIVRVPSADTVDLAVFDKYPQMLLEELIEGDEITVPILGDAALPVIEIIPPQGKEFDYENKYNGATQELCPPVNISSELQAKAQKLVEKIHREASVRHLSRTDIIIDKDDNLWVLELNTIPGMTSQSLFPKAARIAGISMEELVQKFLDMVIA
ncbi:MAG: D-alanine/D-alanine ligase [Candidatus Saccharibacteria bacterium]|nr:D-alanine/D-alanine ligase [Candidatus Saccharibacteria bacterium]